MAIGITWSLRWAVARTGHNYQCRCRGSLKFRRVFAVKPRPYVLYVTKFTSYMKQNYQNLMVRDYAYMFTATKPYQNSGDVLLAISDVLHAGVLLKTSYVRNTCTMGVSQVYKNACCTMLRIILSTDNASAPTWCDWAMGSTFSQSGFGNPHEEWCTCQGIRLINCQHEGCSLMVHTLCQHDWLRWHCYKLTLQHFCQQHNKDYQRPAFTECLYTRIGCSSRLN